MRPVGGADSYYPRGWATHKVENKYTAEAPSQE